MTYQVRLSLLAMDDIETAHGWLKGHLSPDHARRWYDGLKAALINLEKNPNRYPLAPEGEALGIELRELPYGKRKHVYRILYTVEESVVQVHGVWHAARGDFHRN